MKTQFTKLIALILICFFQASCQEVDSGQTSDLEPMEHTFVRQKQLVRRHDCGGNLTSESIETINALTKTYQVLPESAENLWSFRSFKNEGDYKGLLVNRRGIITIDFSPTVFNLRVREGLNEIRYQFGHCVDIRIDQESGEEFCAHPVEFTEEKSLWIEIKYEVIELDGARYIYPLPESCNS